MAGKKQLCNGFNEKNVDAAPAAARWNTGCGFATFTSQDDADRAIAELHDTVTLGEVPTRDLGGCDGVILLL